jgi:formylglycine-generating enzyme required for sulfatase activity
MGKLCVELKVTEEKLLATLDPPVAIDDNKNFKAAIDNADPAYKTQIQGYANAINAKLKAMADNIPKDERKAGETVKLTINDIEYAFCWCPAGTFMMGEEGKQHRVGLSRGYWMLETPVTQGMWMSMMGNNPSNFKGIQLPVEQVSWNDCQEYIKKLNESGKAPAGFKFALPTEAQWEYACRAGTTTAYHFGDTLTREQANFGGGQTSEVGKYPANAWGLKDMHGNVWEWCNDWYGDYPAGAVTDPTGTTQGSYRVIRGGCWGSLARFIQLLDILLTIIPRDLFYRKFVEVALESARLFPRYTHPHHLRYGRFKHPKTFRQGNSV